MKSYRYNHHTESIRSKLIFSRWFLKIIRFYFYHDIFSTFEGKNPYWTKLAKVGLFQHHNHKTCFLPNPKSVSRWAFVKTEHMISRIRLNSYWANDGRPAARLSLRFSKTAENNGAGVQANEDSWKKLWNSCVFVQILWWGPLNSSVRAINPREKISVRNLLDGLRTYRIN